MQLHIPEAKVVLSQDEKTVFVIGMNGTISLTGVYADRFKSNYAAHFDSTVAMNLWEHPTVTLDLALKRFAIRHAGTTH